MTYVSSLNPYTKKFVLGIFVLVNLVVTAFPSYSADTATSKRNSSQNQSSSGTKVTAMSTSVSTRNPDGGPDAAREFAAADMSLVNEDVMPDLFTGTMKYQVPITVPSGINGLQPSVNLVYKSTNGNGWLGVGWDYSPGMVARNTRRGVDFNADDFVVSDASGSQIGRPELQCKDHQRT